MDVWEDPLSGLGGSYGFGGGGPTGFAWGVTNQAPRVGSFYDTSTFGSGDIIGPLVSTGLQFGSGAIQQSRASSAASAQAQQQIESQWNGLVAQALALYTALSAKATITQADYDQAMAAYNALEQFVAQYGAQDNGRITAQWNGADYKGAAQHDLQLYQQRLQAGTASQAAGTSALAAAATAGSGSLLGGISTNTILLILLAVGAVMVFKG